MPDESIRRPAPQRGRRTATALATGLIVALVAGCSAAGGGGAIGTNSDPASVGTGTHSQPGTTPRSSASAAHHHRPAGSSSAASSAAAHPGAPRGTSAATTHAAPRPHTSAGRAASSSAPAAPALAPQLLTLGDLPSGWSTADPNSGPNGNVQLPDCFVQAMRTDQAAENDSVAFVQNQLPLLSEGLGYYPGASAVSNFAAAVGALDSCVGKQVTVSSGPYSLHGTVQTLAVPSWGDASRGYQVSLTGYGFTLGLGIVAVRKGHELLAVVYANQNALDTAALTHFAGQALGKLRAT